MIMRSAVAGAALALAIMFALPASASMPGQIATVTIPASPSAKAHMHIYSYPQTPREAAILCDTLPTKIAENDYFEHVMRVEHPGLPIPVIQTIVDMSGARWIFPLHGLIKLQCPVVVALSVGSDGWTDFGTMMYVSTPNGAPYPGQRWVIAGWKPSR